MNVETDRQAPHETDEELMSRLAAHDAEALAPLYGRYAPIVFHLASQSLDEPSAQDIVQEVFSSVWRNAAVFDPKKGRFRPWLMQIAHYRILNELRRKSRRPQPAPGDDGQIIDEIPDRTFEPARQSWRAYQREAVRSAIERLPDAQKQALSLAFFEDLTQDQVAAVLRLPLGTVKTRIRAAMRKLRLLLAPIAAAAALLLLAGLGFWTAARTSMAARTVRALSFATASDITTFHLPPAQGAPAQTHGSYRGRVGADIAVAALHNLSRLPGGMRYQVWIMHQGSWISMGTALPDSLGDALVVGEGPQFAALPQRIEVTIEPARGSTAPTGQVVISWMNEQRSSQ